MPAFFVFAVTFTVFMLEGTKRFVVAGLEIALYLAVCLIAYRFPEAVTAFPTPQHAARDVIAGCLAASIALAVAVSLHITVYDERQKQLADANAKLKEANAELAQLDRMKTELRSNMSHEMRTPLTVVSVNVQTVLDILEDDQVKDSDAEELLQNAQDEIMRLTRMVDGMLTLSSMSENTDKQSVDLSALLQSCAEMLRLNLQERGNTLETDIDAELNIFGNADMLAQVAANLLQNAGSHTENGVLSLRAAKNGRDVIVTLRDTGTGISPELLPRVFERGVSDGGTGFGLYLCKTVVESHGGAIWIESELGKGTEASFSLPVYEGQFGGNRP
jgi:signal transduction histidine kinase